jgi:hypothetical protein
VALTQGGFGADPFGGTPFGDPFGGPDGQPPIGPMPPAHAAPPQPETNTLATLSVVFAPAGAVLGHLGLSQIARTGQRGRDRALVGITVSYIVIVVAVVALVVWAVSGGDEPSTGAPSAPMSSSATPTTSEVPTTSTPPAPPPPKVDDAALPGVLFGLEELRSLLNDQGLMPVFTADAIKMQPERGSLDDPTCVGSLLKGTPTAYEGPSSGFLAASQIGAKSRPGWSVRRIGADDVLRCIAL